MGKDGFACSVAAEQAFGPTVRGCPHIFDFTLLFEETLLFLLPLGLAVILAVLRIIQLWQRKTLCRSPWPVVAKLTGYTCLSATQCSFLIAVTVAPSTRTTATIASAAFGIPAFLVLGLQSLLEHRRTLKPPTTLILYLLATIPMNIVRCRTLYTLPGNTAGFATFLVFSVASATVLGIESLDKRRFICEDYLPSSREETSDVVRRALLLWIYPLFRTGWRKSLGGEDLLPIDQSLLVDLDFEHARNTSPQAQKKSDTLLWAIARGHASSLLKPIVPRLGYLALTFAQPFLVETATSYVDAGQQTPNYNVGGGLIAAYFIVYVGIAVMYSVYQQKAVQAATIIRNSLTLAISQRVLRLDVATAQATSAPALISANVNSIQMGFRRLHDTWSCLLGTVIALWLLARQLGVSVAPTGVLSFVLIASSLLLSLRAGPRQRSWFEKTGQRVAATTAVLTHMKGVKMMGITQRVHSMLSAARVDEIKRSQSFRMFLIFITSLSYAAMALAPALAIGVHVVLVRSGNSRGLLLDSSTAFSSLTLLSLVTSNMTEGIQAMLSFFTMISCLKRVEKFLLGGGTAGEAPSAPSKETEGRTSTTSRSLSPGPVLEHHAFSMNNVSTSYDDQSENSLSNITLAIPQTGVTMLVGPTGCGKSTLLKVLLGEIQARDGLILTSGCRRAYAAQNPWIMNTTIRANILGPRPLEAERYQQTLQACGLGQDLAEFADGDTTKCGPNGSGLSGGQKKRIAMARAVYAASPVTILDDCLSGLDAKTQAQVLESLFRGSSPLKLDAAAVVLTTTNPNHARWADHVIQLDANGRQVKDGILISKEQTETGFDDESHHSTAKSKDATVKSSPVTTTKMTTKETPQHGNTYRYFIGAVGIAPTCVFLLLCSAFVVALSYPQIYLRSWALYSAVHQRNTLSTLLGVYFGLAFAALAFYVAATTFFMLDMAERSSRYFHRVLLDVTLGTPLHLFQATGAGAFINRFSQDLQQIDRPLPINFVTSAIALLQTLGSIAVIIVGSPWSGLAVPVIGLIIAAVQVVYLRTSRRLRILELEMVAPLFAHLNEALQGLVTIRALDWVHMFDENCRSAIHRAQAPFYLLLQGQNALNLVLDLITAAMAVVVMSVGVGTLPGSPGLGLALFSVVTFGQAVKTFVQTWTMLEISLGAVNRVREYEESTPVETGEGSQPFPGWPLEGSIDMDNVSITYPGASAKAVELVNLHIPAGFKVAICGHSGSGKSTLIASLVRLVDPDTGTISINGLDIASLQKDEVRSKLAVLPQDPVLLPTTVRDNLTLCGPSDDDEIWSSLEAVGLRGLVEQRGSLEARIAESSLSDGELRLLCIARMLLRRSQIVILDEPTSSLDADVERAVMREILQRFKSSTILCVAHRLETVLDFDLVVVMDQGNVIEQGNPREMLDDQQSAFAALWEHQKRQQRA